MLLTGCAYRSLFVLRMPPFSAAVDDVFSVIKPKRQDRLTYLVDSARLFKALMGARWALKSNFLLIVLPMVLDRAINGVWSRPCVEQAIARCPAPVVAIIDNLGRDKCRRVCDLIERAGALLVFLPPWSPDLKPLETAFTRIKRFCDTPQRGPVADLSGRIGQILNSVTQNKACANFRAAGDDPD